LQAISKSEKDILKPWFNTIDELDLFKQKETIIAYPKRFKNDVAIAQSKLNVRKSGVAAGVIKGKDFIPHHELALSHIVNKELPFVEVDYDNAIRYLKRKDLLIDLPTKGWTLVRYEELNLGWIKVLPNRINNYYPPEWRILKD
jgi:NOL1/NOP2/fmu family ribosome biogenesis protein